ncbi:MAG: RHS repeat-associated core domain-containing protein, partial [Rubrivivax sp.]
PQSQTADQNFTFNMRFPGQYLDKETGTLYNYYRTYNPATGRYLQSDPIGLGGGVNTYGYANGSPTDTSDPLGLWGCKLVGLLVICDLNPPPLPIPDERYPPPIPKTPVWPPAPPDVPPTPEKWPKDSKGFCIRTYANCINHDWTGSCEACMTRCIGSGNGDWPFDMCKPKNKWCPW